MDCIYRCRIAELEHITTEAADWIEAEALEQIGAGRWPPEGCRGIVERLRGAAEGGG